MNAAANMFRKKKDDANNQSGTSGDWKVEPTGPGDLGSVGDHPDQQAGFKGAMAVNRRRIGERLAQSTGKQGGDDKEFAERWERVADLGNKVQKVKESMKRQLDASRALCLSCADLGNACSDADVRDVTFQNTQYQLDENIRKTLDEHIVRAIDSLERKLKPFDELDKRVKIRHNLKLDYDHYVRKVTELKQKAETAKLGGNEQKLAAAQARLAEATSSLFKAFNYYDAVGGRLAQPEVEMFKRAQLEFFQAAHSAVKDVPIKDPATVSAEVESIGREGMNRPVHTQYDGSARTGSYSGMAAGGSFTGGSTYGSSSALSPTTGGGSRRGSDDSINAKAIPVATATPVATYDAPWMTNAGSSSAAPGGSSWWDQTAKASTAGSTTAASTAAPPATNPFGAQQASSARPPPPPQKAEQAKALYAYTAQDNTELSLVAGEVINVVEKHSSGWWTGEKGGSRGLFPSNYVQAL